MKFFFLYTIFAIITTGSSRKYYDVEEEALKLYGEDFKSVLLRFRKSTDYMHILNDKVAEIREKLQLIMGQVHRYLHLELRKKVGENLKAGNITQDSTGSLVYKKLQLLRESSETEEETPVMLLEQHRLLERELPTSEINYYKALGFEYAGQGIHTVLRQMGADDVGKSTRLPYADETDQKSTTQHDHDHHVTQSPEPDTTAANVPDFTATPDLLRYKIKKNTNKASG